ncbi:MAG: molecular chaperone DnaJ [Actinomycetota bacterium]
MPDPTDLYALLGVRQDASPEEIKRAYRKLARQHHPDVSGSDGSEEHFKQVSAAYEILSDPGKRQQYDMFGSGAASGQAPFGDFGDILDFFFGGGFGAPARRGPQARAPRSRPGENLLLALSLSFEEAAFGVTKEVQIESYGTCGRCSGTGCKPGTSPSRCSRCGGSGQVQNVQQSIFGTVMTARTCMTCEGTGEEIPERCEECNGEGRVLKPQVATIEVPPGVSDGLELRISGAGHVGRGGGGPGDLYVALRVASHDVFERRGQDLYADLEIPMTQAALGAELEIETLAGTEQLKIGPGTQSGTIIRVRGAGVPHLNRRGAGDLFLNLKVMTPSGKDRNARKLLQDFADLRGESAEKGEVTRAALRRPAS